MQCLRKVFEECTVVLIYECTRLLGAGYDLTIRIVWGFQRHVPVDPVPKSFADLGPGDVE